MIVHPSKKKETHIEWMRECVRRMDKGNYDDVMVLHICKVKEILAEHDAVKNEVDRVMRLPELDWIEATSVIMQVLASARRNGLSAELGTRAVDAIDKAKTYVNRLEARLKEAEEKAWMYDELNK